MLIGAPFTQERSTAAPRTWSDEHLERWGEYYLAHPQIRARGVLFETFLLALERMGACCSNGVMIEKLRHNRIKRARHRRRDSEGRLL